MNQLIIRDKVGDSEDVTVEVESVCAFLFNHFEGKLPPNTVLYHGDFAKNRIPLKTKQDIENLSAIEGTIWCVTYPGLGLGAVAAVAGAVSIGGSSDRGSKQQSSEFQNQQTQDEDSGEPSPNRALTARSNSVRLGQRVPDIFGKVRAYPDLISTTYSIYEDDVEVEYGLYVLGRGSYDISEVKEADTLISETNDSVEFYDPGQDLNTVPTQLVGPAITEPLRFVSRRLPVENGLVGSPPNPSPVPDPGDESLGLRLGSIDEGVSFIINFESSNMQGGTSQVGNVRVQEFPRMIAYFRVASFDANGNFIELQTNEFLITGNQARGIGFTNNLTGGDTYELRVERTVKQFLGQVESTTTTNPIDGSTSTSNTQTYEIIDDQLTILSAFETSPIESTVFEDVTVVRTRSVGGGVVIENRALNCVAARKLNLYNNNGTVASFTHSAKFTDIAMHITTDSFIGARSTATLDIAALKALQTEVETYFGTPLAGEFNYTLDQVNISYEETLRLVGEACFTTFYRVGRTIRGLFEKKTEIGTLLFNHRNKIPDTEGRRVDFGYVDDIDGIEVEWLDADGEPQFIYLPDNSSVNPETLKLTGVKHPLQAHFHASRLWNRVRYERESLEFEATSEANILTVSERVEVADNTRSQTYDGDITLKEGLTLTLSQPVPFDPVGNYTIYLQNADANVVTKSIQFVNESTVILADDDSLDLSLDTQNEVQATYEIVETSDVRVRSFLVTAREQDNNQTASLTLINYDDGYYENDQDFINGVVTGAGV